MRTWKKSVIFFCETLLKRDSSDKNKDNLDKDYLNVAGSVSILVYTDFTTKEKTQAATRTLKVINDE